MAVRPIYTKRGDTQVELIVNKNLTGSTMKTFARLKGTNDIIELTTTIVDAEAGRVAAVTSTLLSGTYDLEVEETTGTGQIATYPDQSYTPLIVVPDLG